MAAARASERASAAPPAEPSPRRRDRRPSRNVLRKVGIGLAGFMVLATAALVRRPQPPGLAANCDKPAFELSSPTRQNRPAAYTMVGPAGRRYALGVDTATFVQREGRWTAVPQPGRAADQVVVVMAESLPKCRRIGYLGLPLALGTHTATMFELTPSGAAVEVQRATFELVPPDEAEPLPRK